MNKFINKKTGDTAIVRGYTSSIMPGREIITKVIYDLESKDGSIDRREIEVGYFHLEFQKPRQSINHEKIKEFFKD